MSSRNGSSKPRIKWTLEEDKKIIELVQRYGTGNWILIAQQIDGKNGKQCRERWTNNLNPELNFSNWTAQEDQLIINLFSYAGSKWAEMAKYLHGRSANAIKNRFRSITRQVGNDSSKQKQQIKITLPPITQLIQGFSFPCPT